MFHETALHHAARVNMVDMIELLMEFGANVYASDNLGKKPIDYTVSVSPAYACLMFYESKFIFCSVFLLNLDNLAYANLFSSTGNPLSLQQLCRITVRMMLGTRASEVIGQLDISHRILSYLQYRDHPASLTHELISKPVWETGVCFHKEASLMTNLVIKNILCCLHYFCI